MPALASPQPRIVLVIARGEAVRNFIYSDTLRELSRRAKVTILTPILGGDAVEKAAPYAEIRHLKSYRERPAVSRYRYLVHNAHFRWIWSEAVKYYWGLHDARAKGVMPRIQRSLLKGTSRLLAHLAVLEVLTKYERHLSWRMRPTREFDELFAELRPDLVFNGSHIHGETADLPLRVAHGLGICTAGFVFSWDNLTSRSRLFVPYDYFLMWNPAMKRQLHGHYPYLRDDQVIVTGTPQFDFHFNSDFLLTRAALCERLGIDPGRPFILYSTGMDSDFLGEHKFVEEIIRVLHALPSPRPQLVVRTYIKGTSPEMLELSHKKIDDVVFPPIRWDKQWTMPLYEDLALYSSLLQHTAFGINAASTVTLELMMLDKPVINLGMEPPGVKLPDYARFSRHVGYEHYRPIAASGGVMVARSLEDLRKMILSALEKPEADSEKRLSFIRAMFDGRLDGRSGQRVADVLQSLAGKAAAARGN